MLIANRDFSLGAKLEENRLF